MNRSNIHIKTKTQNRRKAEDNTKLALSSTNHESLNWLCGCQVNRRTNQCKIQQL